MSTGFSLVLIGIGATLAWAVSATVAGIDIKIVGVVLMVVGAAGLALWLLSSEQLRAVRSPPNERRPDARNPRPHLATATSFELLRTSS